VRVGRAALPWFDITLAVSALHRTTFDWALMASVEIRVVDIVGLDKQLEIVDA
jgi:hypothetical protein